MSERKPISQGQRWRIFARDEFTCQYCGAQPPEVILHVDHRLAVANGGTNEDENLITACQECNTGKGIKSLPAKPNPRGPQLVGLIVQLHEEFPEALSALFEATERIFHSMKDREIPIEVAQVTVIAACLRMAAVATQLPTKTNFPMRRVLALAKAAFNEEAK